MEKTSVIERHPLIRDGRSQEGRQNAALSPESARIDGRSWMDILNFVYHLSRQINFFDERMQRNGDWSAFFFLSGPIQIALISKFDVKTVEKDYDWASANFLNGIDRGNPKPLFDRQFELSENINQWYQNLSTDSSGFRQVFRNLILTNLKFGLTRLIALGKSVPAIEAGYQLPYNFTLANDPIWGEGTANIQPAVFVRASRDTMRRELERRMKETFQVFIKGIEQIVKSAPEYFPKSLNIVEDKPETTNAQLPPDIFQKHEPHLGLLFTFLKLFGQVRDGLNQQSKNHLEFYYKQVLRLTEKEARPDQTHLVFEVSDPLTSFVIGKGTLFSAGEDAKAVVQQFQLDEELLVQRARIANLRTLFIDQKAVIKSINGQKVPFKAVKGVFSALQANSADGQGAGFDGIDPPSWPTLGGKLSRQPDFDAQGRLKPYPEARLGIALASRILLLREGRRMITFRLVCNLPDYLQNPNSTDFRSFQNAVKTKFAFTTATAAGLLKAGFDPDLQVRLMAINFGQGVKSATDFRGFLDVQGLSPDQRLEVEKNIERTLAFRVALSGEKEWIQPHEVDMDLLYDNGQGILQINVQLGPEDPAVLDFNPEVFGFDPGTRFPTAQLELNPAIRFYIEAEGENGNRISEEVSLYQAFREMQIVDLSIEVDVQEVRDIVVQNADGPQDPGGPFPPFGAVPKPGSDFYIGSREAFHKKLYSPAADKPGLSIRMLWDGLPGSFFEHYRMYGERLLRSDFNGKLSLLNNSVWIDLDGGAAKKLFTGLDVRITGSGGAFSFEVADKTEMLMQNPDSLTYSSEQIAKETLGYAMFLALEPANYQKEELPSEGRYRFRFQKTVTVNGTVTPTILAQTKKFAVGKNEEEAKNEILTALTRADLVLTANDFANVQATPVEDQSAFTVASRNGFLRLRLGIPDFLHSQFPLVLTTQTSAVALAAQMASIQKVSTQLVAANQPAVDFSAFPNIIHNAFYRQNNDPSIVIKGSDSGINYSDFTPELPNEPYTPVLKEISLDYRAKAAAFELEAFHLYPFETTNFSRLNLTEENPALLPVFLDPEGDEGLVEKEGSLCLAFEELSPGNTLSLLFQVAEATANPDLERVEPTWHYLRDNQWVRIEPDIQVLSDETKGLITSGVVQLAIPRNINRNNTILPAAYHWLKVSVPARSAAASQTLAIHPQAARVIFVPAGGNDLDRLAKPLEAEKIAAFVVEEPSIKSVVQPYHSFGGKPAEKEDRFYTRVSEWLHHKGRAITLFDFESILLEAFPQVFRTKCVTHTLGYPGQSVDVELAPGHVALAVIPDLRQQAFANRLEPKFSVGDLREMEDYLMNRHSPFVRLQVLNPRYQPISVEGKIRFSKGKSPEFYRQVLEKDVTNFLSPWASGALDRISFGGEIFRSYVLNFIEQRNYVDYVTDFVMRDEQGNEVDQVAARSARSILVSGTHSFDVIEE